MRAPLTNHCFTISVLAAVAITAMYAYVFEASQELIATLLVLGIPRWPNTSFVIRSTSRDHHNKESTCVGKRKSPRAGDLQMTGVWALAALWLGLALIASPGAVRTE